MFKKNFAYFVGCFSGLAGCAGGQGSLAGCVGGQGSLGGNFGNWFHRRKAPWWERFRHIEQIVIDQSLFSRFGNPTRCCQTNVNSLP
jgi:hypothetical protein